MTFLLLFTLLMRSSVVKTIEIDWTKLYSVCIKLINWFLCKMLKYYKIPITLILLITLQNIFCYPQPIILPHINNNVQPAEVNSLEQHNQHPRSIAETPKLYSHNTIENTVKEVEAMLTANPTLPRLTRGEILDLLENITKTDMTKEKLNKNEDVKERDPKAIMVVMPFTPNDKNMEELYTKPPVTHIVGAEPFKKTEKDYSFKRIPDEISNIPELGTKESAIGNHIVYTKEKSVTSTSTVSSVTKEESVFPQYTPNKTNNRRRRPSASINLVATPKPTTYHPTRRPVRRRSTSTERYPNHKYPDDVSTESAKIVTPLPSSGIKIINPPQFSASEINDDLQMQENQQSNTFWEQPKKETLTKTPEQKISMVEDNIKKLSSPDLPLVDIVPENLKGILTDIKPPPEMLPITSTTITTKAPSDIEEEEKIRNMLASFGVLPVKTTTTTTSVPDISNVADNLTPEMRDLLMSFGLIPDSNKNKPISTSVTTEEYDGFNPVKAEVNPEAYLGFKPLPNDDTSRQDMEELLARFGLGRNSRKVKSLPKREDGKEKQEREELNFEVVPEQYMGVLEDIGLTNREGKKIRTEALIKTQEKQHVFNPGEPQYASSKELEKLNKLLDVVKQLEKLNGSVTEEDLRKIDVVSLKEVISSLNEENRIIPLDEQDAPNPVKFDFGLEKNEVKRQENSTSSTTVSPSTSTEEVQTANIKDLEASFGGQVDSSPSTKAPDVETTTQARKTGFYYLVDWNTFLDIDDQKGKRVNLRFQPTVGDPKRFYSISVP